MIWKHVKKLKENIFFYFTIIKKKVTFDAFWLTQRAFS